MGQGADTLSPQQPRRRWRFANAVFDEANWQLSVDGRPVTVEPKPLALLGTLLSRAGQAVSKDELLDAVWPNVVVVEASLPTAIAKLRRALGDDRRTDPIVATVARIGYRIGVPVTIEEPGGVCALEGDIPASPTGGRPWGLIAVGVFAVVALLAIGIVGRVASSGASATSQVSLRQAGIDAVRRLDQTAVEGLIGRGWKPGQPVDREDNDALKLLLARCEWDPAHDRQRLLLLARTLIDGGVHIAHRNVWGDTAYSIALAPRYCGADHPVTRMIRVLCYSGTDTPGAACEADYTRRRPLLPPAALMDGAT